VTVDHLVPYFFVDADGHQEASGLAEVKALILRSSISTHLYDVIPIWSAMILGYMFLSSGRVHPSLRNVAKFGLIP